ncbi:MAG: tetratricopeptide repeat protein [Candidatus Anammoximicrobium sp.]|nr:tetratricopeptide repeat protein [Candidatus Anammoximicrobium sp.]
MLMPDLYALYDEADKLKNDGKQQEAIAKYEEILGIDESFSLAHFALAVAYGKVGDHEKAVQHGQRACQLEPNDPFSFTAMSVTYQRAFAGTRNPDYIHLAEQAMGQAHALQAQQW